jgi:hypothetical protein
MAPARDYSVDRRRVPNKAVQTRRRFTRFGEANDSRGLIMCATIKFLRPVEPTIARMCLKGSSREPGGKNLLSRLNAKRITTGWTACRPAHDDRRASLSIADTPRGSALLNFLSNTFAPCRGESCPGICGVTVYAPPSTARIVAEPAPGEEQTTFEFFSSCRREPAVNRGISLRANQTCRMQPK